MYTMYTCMLLYGLIVCCEFLIVNVHRINQHRIIWHPIHQVYFKKLLNNIHVEIVVHVYAVKRTIIIVID